MINFHFGFEGLVELHKGKLDPNGEPVTREEISKFKNMVLDTGLQRIGENADWMNWLHLGTGIQAPHPLQNALQNATYKGNNYAPNPHTSQGINIEDPLKPYTWTKRVFRVTPRGENRTYSELGVGWNDNNLFSRTLIKDPLGNPNSISILGDEYLDVTYEVRMYIPVGNAVYTVIPTGDDLEPRTVTVQASRINTMSQSFGWGLSYSTSPSGGVVLSLLNNWTSNYHNRMYTGGRGGLYQDPEGTMLRDEGNIGGIFNYTSMVRTSDTSATFSFTRDLPNNLGTIRTIQISQSAYCFQAELNPPFVKNNEERFNFEYSISWGREEG